MKILKSTWCEDLDGQIAFDWEKQNRLKKFIRLVNIEKIERLHMKLWETRKMKNDATAKVIYLTCKNCEKWFIRWDRSSGCSSKAKNDWKMKHVQLHPDVAVVKKSFPRFIARKCFVEESLKEMFAKWRKELKNPITNRISSFIFTLYRLKALI